MSEQPAGSFTQHTDRDTIETVFRTIISVNQLSIHEAVSDMCGEYRICQARTRAGRTI